MIEKRPMSNRKAPVLDVTPITFEGRTLMCPFTDPVKIAAWLREWRNSPALQLAEMRSRLACLEQQARRG